MFVWNNESINIAILNPNFTPQLPGQSHNGAAAVAEAFLSLKARIHKILDPNERAPEIFVYLWKEEIDVYNINRFWGFQNVDFCRGCLTGFVLHWLLNNGCFSVDTFFHDYRECIFRRKMLCVAVKIGEFQWFCISQMYPS